MKVKLIEMTKLCLFSSLLVVSSTSLWAQTSVNQIDNLGNAKSDEVTWSSDITMTYSSNLNKPDSVNFASAADFEGTMAAVFKGTRFALTTSITKNLTGEREANMNNASISAARSLYKFNKELSLSGSTSVLIPFSESSRDYQKQITGISVATPLIWRSNAWRLSYSPSLRKNFHETKTSLTGASNYEYILGNSVSALYQFSIGAYAQASASYSRLYTYRNNQRDNYRFTQVIGYPIDNFDIAIGHVLGGSPLAVNGVETDIRFFDSRDSTVFGMLTVSF